MEIDMIYTVLPEDRERMEKNLKKIREDNFVDKKDKQRRTEAIEEMTKAEGETDVS